MSDSFDTQVAIVGGGPAGAALQIRLAHAGVESVLFERAAQARWRACGVFSSPLTRGCLRDLGVSDQEMGRLARPISALRVRTQRGAMVRLEYASPAGHACGFDRVAVDGMLLDKARAAAVVKTSSVVTSIGLPARTDEPVHLTVSPTDAADGSSLQQWRARLVVGADGPRSLVARSAGVSTTPRLLRKAGITFHESDPVAEAEGRPMVGEFLLGDGWYVGVAPVPGRRLNIGIVVPSKHLAAPLDEIVARTRGLMRDSGMPPSDRLADERMVALPLRHRVTRASGRGFLLAGDAAGFIDPLTGEGLHRALVSAELAADSITRSLRGDARALDDYDRHLRARFRTKDVVSWVLQAFLAQPGLLGYAVRRLASRSPQREVFTLVLTDQLPASRGLDPRFLARLLAP